MASKSERKKKSKIGEDRSVMSKAKKKSFFSSVGSLFSCWNCKSDGKSKKKVANGINAVHTNGAVANYPANETTPHVDAERKPALIVTGTDDKTPKTFQTIFVTSATDVEPTLNSELYVSLESGEQNDSLLFPGVNDQTVPGEVSKPADFELQNNYLPVNEEEKAVESEVPQVDEQVKEPEIPKLLKEEAVSEVPEVDEELLLIESSPKVEEIQYEIVTSETIDLNSNNAVSETVEATVDTFVIAKGPFVQNIETESLLKPEPETRIKSNLAQIEPIQSPAPTPLEETTLVDLNSLPSVKNRIASYAAIIASSTATTTKETALSSKVPPAPAKPPRALAQTVRDTEPKTLSLKAAVNAIEVPVTIASVPTVPDQPVKKPTVSLKKTQSESQTKKSSSMAAPPAKGEKTVKRANTVKTEVKKTDEVVAKKNVAGDAREEKEVATYEEIVVYEFNFPRRLCGKLIGKNGVHVDHIRSKTRTQIAVRNDPQVDDLQIVCVSGKMEDVDLALEIISNRFPAKYYASVSFKPISKPILYRRQKSIFENNSKVFVAPNLFVDLLQYMPTTSPINLDGAGKHSANYHANLNEDKFPEVALAIHVASVVNAAHVFIQLPSNPMFGHLTALDKAMSETYSNAVEGNDETELKLHLMTDPVEHGTICAAPTSYGWHRAIVINYMSNEDVLKEISDYPETCGLVTIRFLDYGGYLTIPANQLRQLRSDFMLLPFQSVECYLDGIFPIEGTEENGKSFFKKLIRNSQMKGILTGYAEDGTPAIRLYVSNDVYTNECLNSVLVGLNYAFYPIGDADSAFGSHPSIQLTEEESPRARHYKLDQRGTYF